MTESAPQRRATKRRTTTSRGPHRSVSSTHANQGVRTSRGYRSAPPQDLGNVMAREVRGTRGDRPRQVRAAHQHGSRSRRYSPEMTQLRSGVDRRISDNRVRNVRRSNGRKNKFPFVPLIAAVAVLLVVAIVRLVFFAQPDDMAAFRPADTRLSAAIAESTDVFTSPYDWGKLEKDDKGRFTYVEDDKVVSRTGIDVSSHSGTIDWKKVAADGIDFAYIRIGYRGTVEGNVAPDTSFEKNFSEAKAAGLDVGVYFFSQAINEDEAIEEADFVISTLGSNGLRYPVAFDMEPSTSGSDRISSLSNDKRNAAARAFCKELKSKGYNAIVYGSRSDLASYDLSDFIDYGFWFADYSDHPMMSLRLGIWQYSDEATVDGIPEKVDLDLDLMDVLARAEAEKGEGSSGSDKRSN